MRRFFMISGILVQAAVIGAVIHGSFIWRRRTVGAGRDRGIGTPRRFYFYSISFIALMLLVSGVTMVLMSLLDELFGEPVVRNATTRLATGLALTIVGVPLWAFHWRFAQRSTTTHPAERRSILRKLYLYVTAGVALAFLAYNVYEVIEWMLGVGDFPTFSWAAVLVWAPVWAYHWVVASAETPETTLETLGIRRLYLYLASALGIAMLAGGAGFLLHVILLEGYSAAFEASVIGSGSEGLWRETARTALSVAVVGGAIWWAHWTVFASTDRDSALRWVYLFAAAIGGGVITALVGFGIALDTLLTWILGASTDPAGSHFRAAPDGLAALAVGVAMWVYFRRRMTIESVDHEAAHVDRTYDLLIAGIGLFALSIASTSILDMFFKLIAETSPVVVGGDVDWRVQLSTMLTTLAIGAPAWWIHWLRIQSASSADPEAERTALPRKLFVLGVLCLGLLALVGGATSTLFIVLRDLLDADLSANTLRDLSTGLAVTLTALFVIPYHWVIYRQDRELEPDVPEQPLHITKSVTLLTAEGGLDLLAQVEAALGCPVTAAHWPDPDAFVPTLDDEQIACLSAEVASAPGSNVILIPDASGLRVVSHD